MNCSGLDHLLGEPVPKEEWGIIKQSFTLWQQHSKFCWAVYNNIRTEIYLLS